MSSSGGLYKAIENAEAIGARCIQIFGASPRGWVAHARGKEDIMRYRTALEASNVKAIYLHAAYLVNLASPAADLRKKSVKSLSDHLAIAEAIGANGLIFHIGSGKELPKEEAFKMAIEGMKAVLKAVPGKAQLVIENAAGGGQKIGANAKDIGAIMRAVGFKRVKVCFDTAHAFEAGLIDEYTPAKTKKLFDEWEKEVGMENIVALHVNDSKTVFNSHHDRHENIGEGHIGLAAFKNLAREKRIAHTAWLLEVPGFDGMGPDKKNVDLLKSCLK